MGIETVFFHVLAVVFTAVVVIRADSLGMSWIRGQVETLDANKIRKLHNLTYVGLAIILLTGFIMFWDRRGYLLTNTAFLIKMGFVGALIINSFFIGKLSKIPETKSFLSLNPSDKNKLFVSGAVSTICWIGALISAFFL